MQSDSTTQGDNNNVINLFTGTAHSEQHVAPALQICPEASGLSMLYSNQENPDRLIAVPIMCWALKPNGDVVGMVPWINEITDCHNIDKQLNVCWEGYYCEKKDDIFFEPPEMIVAQLAVSARFCDSMPEQSTYPSTESKSLNAILATNSNGSIEPEHRVIEELDIIQEIPDLVGTHALLLSDDQLSLTLTPVVSWILDSRGQLHGTLVDENLIEQIPALPGDDCLYSAISNPNFRCFFQRDIAENIRQQDSETMQAVEQLLASAN